MTVPDPAAYESLERRFDTVLGADDAGTLRAVLASLSTKDDLAEVKDDLAEVRDDLALVVLDLADLKKDMRHGFELADERVHKEINRLIKWMVPTILGSITAGGTSLGVAAALVG